MAISITDEHDATELTAALADAVRMLGAISAALEHVGPDGMRYGGGFVAGELVRARTVSVLQSALAAMLASKSESFVDA